MNYNKIKVKEKIFPFTKNMDDLLYDEEGLWSISHPRDADKISHIIANFTNTNKLNILDATAGLGGNLLSFAKLFHKTTGIELDKTRFKLLENNIKCYNYDNITLINDNCLNHLKDYDVYFFDPPWGGPEYKKKELLNLYLGNTSLDEIVKIIPKNKYIVLKVPYNYNINLLKDYDITIKKIRNILIILIKT